MKNCLSIVSVSDCDLSIPRFQLHNHPRIKTQLTDSPSPRFFSSTHSQYAPPLLCLHKKNGVSRYDRIYAYIILRFWMISIVVLVQLLINQNSTKQSLTELRWKWNKILEMLMQPSWCQPNEWFWALKAVFTFIFTFSNVYLLCLIWVGKIFEEWHHCILLPGMGKHAKVINLGRRMWGICQNDYSAI